MICIVPSVQTSLMSRICKACGVYFAAKYLLQKHSVTHKANQSSKISKKAKPLRVAAKRKTDYLAITADGNDKEQADWMGERAAGRK